MLKLYNDNINLTRLYASLYILFNDYFFKEIKGVKEEGVKSGYYISVS